MKFRSAFLEILLLDGGTERKKEQKCHLLSFHSRNNPIRHKVNVNCCRLLPTKSVPVIFSVLLYSIFTVQILYKLYSLQLDSTYSNYTEAAATCLAEQQHKTVELLSSEVQ